MALSRKRTYRSSKSAAAVGTEAQKFSSIPRTLIDSEFSVSNTIVEPKSQKSKIEPEENTLASDRRKKEFLGRKFLRPNPNHFQQEEVVNNSQESAFNKRWTVMDDVALVSAVTHLCDLKVVYNVMKFSKKYSLAEIEERWYELLYQEDVSHLARKRMDALSRDKLRAIQATIPFSPGEEEVLQSIPSNVNMELVVPSNAQTPVKNTSLVAQLFFEKILVQNSTVFHQARTPKVLEEHWRELKYYGLVVDQKPTIFENDLLHMEKTLDLCSLVDEDESLPLDIEERHITRNLVVNEREAEEWEKVYINTVSDILPHVQMSPETLGMLRGRYVIFSICKEEVFIGRATRRHPVDVNLTLEGPSARISRKQALMKVYENNKILLHNLGKHPVYVDGRSVLQGDKAALNNNSIIEISIFKLYFIRNENYKKYSFQLHHQRPHPSRCTQ